MRQIIKIVYSNYYYDEVIKNMLKHAQKKLNAHQLVITGVPGSFEIPFEIASSIKEDTEDKVYPSLKEKGKKEIRDNIVQMAKLSQLNILVT